MPQRSIADLLESMGSKDREEAWAEFLNDYSSLIYQVVRHFETDVDNASDCFQFVCERLLEGRSKKLRQFKTDGSARFTTWLRAVVRNLCIDWHRMTFGRQRRFDSIARLTAFDQEVFRLVYERGISTEESLMMLGGSFPAVTPAQLEKSRERIETGLTNNQRWLLSSHVNQQRQSSASLDDPDRLAAEIPDPRPDPEMQAVNNERQQKLQRALKTLSAQERMLIRLRFEQGLTLEQTAKLLGLGNAQRTDRQIKEILTRLRKKLS
jgi:RNA polymerase sigma factor (sigma-70 family)